MWAAQLWLLKGKYSTFQHTISLLLWWEGNFFKLSLIMLFFSSRRERNAPRPKSLKHRWSSHMQDAPAWRSTAPSIVAHVWTADAAPLSRPGLSRSGSAATTARPSPRMSWWSSLADATTTAPMQTRPTLITDYSMTSTNLETKLRCGQAWEGGWVQTFF